MGLTLPLKRFAVYQERETLPEESLSDLVRKQLDGKPKGPYLSLGEIVQLQYNGQEIQIADVATKLRNGHGQNIMVTKVIKKRASYKRYLDNRDKRKELIENDEGPQLPEISLPDIQLPTLPD